MPNCVAAIDIGTNTVRLLIRDAAGHALARELCITRLGEGVDASGLLAPSAIERTTTALAQFADTIARHRPERLRVVATSAARDALNRQAFFTRVHGVLGVEPELLAGKEEAALSFAGARMGRSHANHPCVVMDIGGGSTELALGHEEVELAISLDLGSVRISERCLHGDPPTAVEIAAALAQLHRGLAPATELRAALQQEPWRTSEWIGVAGSVTTVAAFVAGLRQYDASVTHGMRLSARSIRDALTKLAALPVRERRSLLIEPKRAEAIVGGSLVLHALCEYFAVSEITVSESDILDALAASLLEGG